MGVYEYQSQSVQEYESTSVALHFVQGMLPASLARLSRPSWLPHGPSCGPWTCTRFNFCSAVHCALQSEQSRRHQINLWRSCMSRSRVVAAATIHNPMAENQIRNLRWENASGRLSSATMNGQATSRLISSTWRRLRTKVTTLRLERRLERRVDIQSICWPMVRANIQSTCWPMVRVGIQSKFWSMAHTQYC